MKMFSRIEHIPVDDRTGDPGRSAKADHIRAEAKKAIGLFEVRRGPKIRNILRVLVVIQNYGHR